MTNPFSHALRTVGPLRLALALMALLAVALMPPPGTPVTGGGWSLFTGLVVPALIPLLLAVFLLDVLMALVLMKDKTGSERRRYRWIILADLGFSALLLAVFVPLIVALRRG